MRGMLTTAAIAVTTLGLMDGLSARADIYFSAGGRYVTGGYVPPLAAPVSVAPVAVMRPVVVAPVYAAPTYVSPVYMGPVYVSPVYGSPVYAPVVVRPVVAYEPVAGPQPLVVSTQYLAPPPYPPQIVVNPVAVSPYAVRRRVRYGLFGRTEVQERIYTPYGRSTVEFDYDRWGRLRDVDIDD